MTSTYTEVQVFSYKDPTKMVDVLPNATSPQFLEEITGNGAGQFTVTSDDFKVAANLSLLDYRNIIKLSCNGTVRAGFVLGNQDNTLVDSAEAASKSVTVSGDGLKSWLGDATVFPPVALKLTSPDDRVFSFASPRGSWYDASQWKRPVLLEKYHLTDDPQTDPSKRLLYNFRPAEWPDAPQAYWVWSRALTVSANGARSHPEGTNFFRYEFSTAEKASYSLFAACDDQMTVFVDSALAIEADEGTSANMYETLRYDFDLEPGNHVIAFRVTNLARGGVNNPGALIAAFFKAGDANIGTSAQLLSYTGAPSGWYCTDYPSTEPGWSPGEILLTLRSEAIARGVRTMGYLKPTFTVDVDSSGVPWKQKLPYSFSIGDSYLDVINQMEDLEVECWIDPATYTWNVSQSRGRDRSMQTISQAPVTLREGWNLTQAGTTGEADLTNSLAMKTSDGWINVDDATSVGKYGRIEGTLSTNINSSQSQALAKKVFSTHADAEEGSTYSLIPRPGAVPYVDFGIGDYVQAPNKTGAMVKRRVMSISITTDDSGNPLYVIEFDTILQTKQQEYDRISKIASGSGLGSGYTSANGNVSSGTSPTSSSGSTTNFPDPAAPANVRATSVGTFTALGDPSAKATVSWDLVSSAVDGTAIKGVANYIVYGRLASDPSTARTYATVDGSLASAVITGLASGTAYQFWVKAYVSASRISADSAVVNHTTAVPATVLTPPSDPVLTTKLGTVVATWDGKMAGNATPPTSLLYVFAEFSTSQTGNYSTIGNNISSASTIAITGLTIGNAYYVRLRARDKAGNISAPSNPVSITVSGVDVDDLGQQFEDDYNSLKQQSADAQSAASDAQTKAQEALDAAQDAANAAGGVIYQADTPSAEDSKPGRLWIKSPSNTPYLYNSTSGQWEEVTDQAIVDAAQQAANALQQAQQANNTAQTAAEQAGQALESADGKSTNWWLPDAPAGTDHQVNDTWFDTDDGNKMYYWDGSAWQPKQLGTNAISDLAITNAKISNLDAGKISTGFLDAGRIQSASITSRMLAVGDFKDYFSGSDFENNALIPWTNLPDGTVSTIDGSVSHFGMKSAKFTPPSTSTGATTTITNGVLDPRVQNGTYYYAYGAGGSANVGSSIRTGLAIATPQGTIPNQQAFRVGNTSGSNISYIDIRAYQNGVGPTIGVSAGVVYNASVYCRTSLAGNPLGYLYVLWSDSSGNTLRTDQSTALAIPSNQFGRVSFVMPASPSGATGASIFLRLAPSGGVDSGIVMDGTFWMLSRGATVPDYFDGSFSQFNSDTDTYSWQSTADASNSIHTIVGSRTAKSYTLNTDIPVQAGQSYAVDGWGYRDAAFNGNSAGTYIQAIDTSTNAVIGTVPFGYTVLGTVNAWTEFTGAIKVPSGTSTMRLSLSVNHSAGNLWLDDLTLKVQAGGTLIADGAISTNKIAANAVTANQIAAGTITATQIAANAISTDQLAATAITAKHTITGALVQTAATGARTQMTTDGIRVVNSANQVVVLLGYNIDTGLSVRNPSTGVLTPIANMAFGTSFFARGTVLNLPTVAAENTWSAYLNESYGGTYSATSNRAMVLTFALATNQTVSQNFNIGLTLDLLGDDGSSVRVVADQWITWTTGFYMAVVNLNVGANYTVRNAWRTQRAYSGTGTPSVTTRSTIVMPL